MLAWLAANLATILVAMALLCVVWLIARGIVRDRKAGKSSCGGNCATCGSACHQHQHQHQ